MNYMFFINKLFLTGLLDGITPFSILSEKAKKMEARNVIRALGITQLGYILRMSGVIVGLLVIFWSLITLMIVNYPKTVMQTKTIILQATIVIVIIMLLPEVMDAIHNLITSVAGIT